MRKSTVLTFVACVMLIITEVCSAQAGEGGPGPIPGVGGVGPGRRVVSPPPAHPSEKGPIVKAQDTEGTPGLKSVQMM